MSTREQILDAAWKLFGERGFEDVSVRDVTNAAGVNLASVSYHFGSKTGLIQEVVKKTLNPANQHRLELLDKFAKEYGGIDKIPIRSIVDAFVRPVSFPEEHGSNQDIVARLAARYLIERDYNVPNPVIMLFGEVFKKFVVAMKYQLPNLSEDVILNRFLFCTGSTLHYHSFSGLASKIAGHNVVPEPEERYQQLLDFCVHGFGGGQ
ncbi:transcriptional regulator, TetR family [Rubritalea squalenifaciens DSM 18772]|uniref:Transcriptional regulator, TetR family n=2 Tax=Rubritalea TaxID=361050 RepID=A0A1M6HGB6_9BACT|nr:TetR/AcrR family transcriptional regulator [Rubritalea squalenifaciens]SHJ21205.1 transcriptional regulator, TetR family [Rubritalea squalenifaciens DSM 18772]